MSRVISAFQVVGFVSVKRRVVFEQSPLLSSEVIAASLRPNVVIVTYIPGKYAAWFSTRVWLLPPPSTLSVRVVLSHT